MIVDLGERLMSNKKSSIRLIIYLKTLLLLSISFSAWPTDYYFSSSGDDSLNTGLSEQSPWRSIDKINSLTLQPGDRVLLKRGDKWRGQIDAIHSGLPGQPVTYTYYGTAGSNPLILKTELPKWWQDSEANGGFELFVDSPPNLEQPNFPFPWNENIGSGAFVKADNTAALIGNYAARLERIDTSSSKPRLRLKKTLANNTSYYTRFYYKTADIAQTGQTPQILSVTVRDEGDPALPGDDRWWDDQNGEWVSQPISITSLGSQFYQTYNFTFQTDAITQAIDIRFEILNGTGIAWLDEVILLQGNTEPVARIWTGFSPSAGKIFGMMDSGQRIPTRSGINNQNQLDDGEFYYFNNFYYRKDSGVPINAEVGRYMNAIRIHSEDPGTGVPNTLGVHNIIIDGIDVMGPGTRAPGLTRDREAGGGIFITPGSHDITVRNLTASSMTSAGVDAGIFRDDAGIFTGIPNPYNILYDNIVSHSNWSTGIYLRGSGTIRNCLTFDNGTLPQDTGDRGGIGLQEGPSIVEDNEIYNLGTGETVIDYAISACCYIGGQFIIRRNHIHDVANGGIQLDNRNLPPTNFSHLVEYNIINRYGLNFNTNSFNHGQFAAVRIRNFQGNVIRNNLIANGGPHFRSKGIVLWEDVQNTYVNNNIFFNNTQADFRIVHNSIYAGLQSDNNIFIRPDYTDAWWLESLTPDSLTEWQAVSGQLDLNSSILDPQFVNATNDDYRLQPTSPAIDAGIDTGQLIDFVKNPFLQLPDIGPYEFGHDDSDNDGLIDYDEICHDNNCTTYDPYDPVTNPSGGDLDLNNPDTDGDGYTDGTEDTSGSDPLDANSTPVIAPDGDVSLNGQVNVADVLLAQRHAFGLDLLNSRTDCAWGLSAFAKWRWTIDCCRYLIDYKKGFLIALNAWTIE